MRDSYTNRNHCPSHDMWSYERDGRCMVRVVVRQGFYCSYKCGAGLNDGLFRNDGLFQTIVTLPSVLSAVCIAHN